MHELVQLAKGLIGAGDLNPGGTMRPEAAERLISMVFADPFLKNITTRRMKRLTADVMVFGLNARQLLRLAEGTKPTSGQTAAGAEAGCTLTALPVQLFPTITLSWLRDNADNPTLLQDLEAQFAQHFANEYLDLGFNGTLDDNSAGFLTLNKGWIKIAMDTVACTKVDIDPATNGWLASLKATVAAIPDKYRPRAALIMNEGDADAYAYELGYHVVGNAQLAESPLRRFMGRPILTSAYCPTGKVLATPPDNLIFGLHTDMRADRVYDSRARALEYTFDQACDYEIAVKEACVLAYNIP